MATTSDELLRLDYAQTTGLLRDLGDVRFKLLALVPTLAGLAVGLLGRDVPASARLAVGLLGLAATIGILLYELRNTQIQRYAVGRARALEAQLGFEGLFTTFPERRLRLFSVVSVDRDGALALVYGAALAGWSYLVAWGALHELHAGHAQAVGAIVAVVVGVFVVAEVVRLKGS